MKKYILGFVGFMVIAAVAGGTALMWLSQSITPITACDPIGEAAPLCGWQNPEDMAALPGGDFVLVSEYGGMAGEQAGSLALLNLNDHSRTVLYTGGSGTQAGPWGAESCTSEVAEGLFSPHGLHLSQRADGSVMALAVQHGGRESVEMFEMVEDDQSWTLTWRGCVIAPEGSLFNDVAATPEGGFLVTHMMPKRNGGLGMALEFVKVGMLGIETGHVLSWHPTSGFTDLPPLDNVTWTPQGSLLVAGAATTTLPEMITMMNCEGIEAGSCPGSFTIIEVDPVTLESEIIYTGGPNTPSGAGTVGLRVDDGSLLIGTFAGDRIVRVSP